MHLRAAPLVSLRLLARGARAGAARVARRRSARWGLVVFLSLAACGREPGGRMRPGEDGADIPDLEVGQDSGRRVAAMPGLAERVVVPQTASVGQPVSLRLWAGGSGSIACNRPDGITVSWAVEDREVVVQPWFRVPIGDVACTMDFRDYAFDTTLVFPTAGRWQIRQPRGGEGPDLLQSIWLTP